MDKEISDKELAGLVKENNDEKALTELIDRHSGIYIEMVKRFAYNKLPEEEVNDIINEKDYNIYMAALYYNNEKSKFPTYLANKTKYICLTKRTINKNKKKFLSIEDIDFMLYDQNKTPDEVCLFSDSFQNIINIINKDKDKRVKDIFFERYLGGEFNKTKTWDSVAKKIGLSSQACINIHNRTLEKIKTKLDNDRIKF